jgi:YegS/Rv2252/BmrU family lipid kinase
MRLQLIVNPRAGGGRGARVLPRYQQLLSEHDVITTVTRDIAHADELAAGAVADGRTVVAVGGDGLVGRVAGTVARAGGLLGVLPGGRGNDFARSLAIPADPAAAVSALVEGHERRIDLGHVDGRPYACIASVGFDSDVQEFALRTRLPLGGQVYTVGALRGVARWRPATFTLTEDGVERTVTGWSVAVANTGTYGGGMRVAPDADPADGELDVVTTARTSRLRFLAAFPKVFTGTHVALPEVSVGRARTVRIEADRAFRVFADGDPIGTLPVTVGVLPSALRLLAPAPRPPSDGPPVPLRRP